MLVILTIIFVFIIFLLMFLGAIINEEIKARQFENKMRDRYTRRLP